MKNLILLLVVCCQFLSLAELKLKNPSDQAIFESSKILASQILAKSPTDKLGNNLVKFTAWMNANDPAVKAMKMKLVFQEKVAAINGDISNAKLANKILARQAELKEDTSRRLLYISLAVKLDPEQTKDVQAEFAKFDMNFNKLLKEVEPPILIDPLKEAARQAKIEAENRKLAAESNKPEKTEMDKILDGVIFPTFSYSESSAVHAINTLTHNLFWRGCQIILSGKRLHYIKSFKSSAGATFYESLFPLPVEETYTLQKKSVRQILMHMAANLKLQWKANEQGVVIYDSDDMSLAEPVGEDTRVAVTEDGIASNDLQKLLGNMALADLKEYRGKVLDMNGQITGFGRGFGTEYYVSLDGGKTRLYFNMKNADSKIYKRLKIRVDKWKAEGGLQAMRDKIRELEKNAEDINRASLAEPKLFLNFKALCASVERGRLIFKDPEIAFVKASGEYLVKPETESGTN
ncbi:MAG: hypothetical protein MK132_22310 [Lentisphaerales bacterium]|nr:hypothetical protein [Lentisphaerales bacterium]